MAALGYLTGYARKHLMDGRHCLADIVRELERLMKEKGFEAVCESGWLPAGLAAPRTQEIFACLNRYRKMNL